MTLPRSWPPLTPGRRATLPGSAADLQRGDDKRHEHGRAILLFTLLRCSRRGDGPDSRGLSVRGTRLRPYIQNKQHRADRHAAKPAVGQRVRSGLRSTYGS